MGFKYVATSDVLNRLRSPRWRVSTYIRDVEYHWRWRMETLLCLAISCVSLQLRAVVKFEAYARTIRWRDPHVHGDGLL